MKYKESGEPVEGCEITFNNQTKIAGKDGDIIFDSIPAGRYNLKVRKEYMESVVIENFNLYSDTVITILLDSARYKVTYHLVDSYNLADIPFVKINVGPKAGTTDANGTATFF